MFDHTSEADAVRDLTFTAVQPVPCGNNVQLVRDNDDWRVIDLDAYSDRPRRIVRDRIAHDAASFIDYVRRIVDDGTFELFEGADTLEVWADVEKRTISALLDGVAGWGAHTIQLQLKPSPEWAAWSMCNGKRMEQIEFAEFIEDQLSTIAEPDGTQLLEIVQSIQATNNVQYESTEWLDNGQRAFVYREDIEAKAGRQGRLTVPSTFTLGLRPFLGSDPFRITARLRYSITGGRLLMGFRLVEPERALETAFGEIIQAVDASLPVRVNHGRV